MRKIVLASHSPRRKYLLEKCELKIQVCPSNIRETKLSNSISLQHHALSLALSKAEAVAKKFPDALVIGADTIVVYKNKLYGKPKDIHDATRILQTLSNTKHYVYTALAVIDSFSKKRYVDIDETTVHTRKIPLKLIKKLAWDNHDKAGAYGVQEKSDLLVKRIDGDYYNVVGLPLKKLRVILGLFGVIMKDLKIREKF